jgi:hypothetical protein
LGLVEELEDILKHIELNGYQAARLKLLVENDAISALEHFINSEPKLLKKPQLYQSFEVYQSEICPRKH